MFFFFFLMIRRPPRSTLFPTRRSSDLLRHRRAALALTAVPAATPPFLSLLTQADDTGPSPEKAAGAARDRKSTRLNSSHANISYAVFCLKKKKIQSDV